MPFLVKHLIEGKPSPVTIQPEDTVMDALKLMTKHDYSQLPVISSKNQQAGMEIPLGMVTYESVLRGVRSFKAKLEDLHVRDVIIAAPTFSPEDDLFDLLVQLKRTNAVLIVNAAELLGIVTSYDSTEYFRSHAEHIMRVEDIETTIKEINLLAYTHEDGAIDETRLAEAVAKVSSHEGPGSKPKTYDDLTLWQYILILLNKQTWLVFEPVFQISRDVLHNILEDVRNTRNDLAHFRSEITPEQIEQLRYCADWLASRWEAYQKTKQEEMFRRLFESNREIGQTQPVVKEDQAAYPIATVVNEQNAAKTLVQEGITVIAEEASPGESRYTPLADWLLSQPGGVDQVTLSFNEIEAIIDGDLPESAHNHRAWWANDSQNHPQSRLWLELGWRSSYVNMTEGRVTFNRIQEREKAYIAFFSKLFSELRSRKDFTLREISPGGMSWIVCQTIAPTGFNAAVFAFSFTRSKLFRAELYLDTYDQVTTKAAFDRIYTQKAALEAQLGEIHWERIDDKRASRIALYHSGAITDSEENLVALRAWAVDKMIAFYKAIQPIASQALQEVLQP